MKKIIFGFLLAVAVGLLTYGTITFAGKLSAGNAYFDNDARGNVVEVSKSFSTADATATPQTSPLTVSSTEIDITVPAKAVELIIVYTDQSIRISEVTGMARYFVLPAGYSHTLQIANTSHVYLKRDSADATVQFYFRFL